MIHIFKGFTGRNFEGRTLRFFAFDSLLVPTQFLVVYFSNVQFIFEKIGKK